MGTRKSRLRISTAIAAFFPEHVEAFMNLTSREIAIPNPTSVTAVLIQDALSGRYDPVRIF